MTFWSIFGLVLFLLIVYLIVRKIYVERKVQNERNQLAGKVVVFLFYYYFVIVLAIKISILNCE